MAYQKLPRLFTIAVGIAISIRMLQYALGNKIYRSNCRRAAAFDVTDIDKMLTLDQVNVLKTISAVSPPQCAMKCTAASNCRSYNYKQAAISNCQLLDIDKNAANSKLVNAEGWRHYEAGPVAAVRLPFLRADESKEVKTYGGLQNKAPFTLYRIAIVASRCE